MSAMAYIKIGDEQLLATNLIHLFNAFKSIDRPTMATAFNFAFLLFPHFVEFVAIVCRH